MYRTEDVLATLGMVRQHKLDVRTVTMGVDLQPCAAPDLSALCARIRERLLRYARRLRAVCEEVEGRYGIPIVNRRLAVSPIASVAAGQTTEGYLEVARTLDAVAAEVEVDLVGGFTPEMREADDEAVRRSRVFVDTPAALEEAGDVVQPLASGLLRREDVADLFDLVHGRQPGRRSADEITLFKSVGAALEDLAAADMAYERLSR